MGDRRAEGGPGRSWRGAGLLSGMRIRKKLLLLHTVFSVGLAGVLLATVRPAVTEIVTRAEANEAVLALNLLVDDSEAALRSRAMPGIDLRFGTAGELGLAAETAERVRSAGAAVVRVGGSAVRGLATGAGGELQYVVATARIPEARRAVFDVYLLVVVA
ncbi:MAG: hypothetical protein AAGF47_07570, partial [Planctomycetota bacterium]